MQYLRSQHAFRRSFRLYNKTEFCGNTGATKLWKNCNRKATDGGSGNSLFHLSQVSNLHIFLYAYINMKRRSGCFVKMMSGLLCREWGDQGLEFDAPRLSQALPVAVLRGMRKFLPSTNDDDGDGDGTLVVVVSPKAISSRLFGVASCYFEEAVFCLRVVEGVKFALLIALCNAG